MGLNKVIGERMVRIHQADQHLRPGQIIQGSILKIYPDNKAQIQLGPKKMIAQLEASLSIKGNYHFQVQATDQMIHLKVIGEQLMTGSGAIGLMTQLGLKNSGNSSVFIQSLIDENIPFDRAQLTSALQILDSVKNKGQSQQVLLEMIARKLPITKNVFQAILAHKKGSYSSQITDLLLLLKTSESSLDSLRRLEQIIEPPISESKSLVKHIVADNNNDRQQLFHVLRGAGMLNQNVDLSTWNSEWRQHEQAIKQDINVEIKLPFELKQAEIAKVLETLNMNKQTLAMHSKEVFAAWENKLTQALTKNTVLPQGEFTYLKDQLTQRTLPLLPVEHRQFINQLQNNPNHLSRLFAMLENFSNQQTYQQLDALLNSMALDKLFLSGAPKEKFMQQLNQVLQYTGLDYENQLAPNIPKAEQSIKMMMLELIQQDGPLRDKAAQFVHFINGMQLNSVTESTSFIQASLQIPAEKLGLNQDLELEFESRKTKDGKVDPDYCRILFYLDLKELKQTIIDMNIQKRLVSITIYNDFQGLKENTASLRPVLKQGLDSLSYQLSSLHFKPLQQQEKAMNRTRLKTSQLSYQGVDFRI